jgi:hypothetical protein
VYINTSMPPKILTLTMCRTFPETLVAVVSTPNPAMARRMPIPWVMLLAISSALRYRVQVVVSVMIQSAVFVGIATDRLC